MRSRSRRILAGSTSLGDLVLSSAAPRLVHPTRPRRSLRPLRRRLSVLVCAASSSLGCSRAWSDREVNLTCVAVADKSCLCSSSPIHAWLRNAPSPRAALAPLCAQRPVRPEADATSHHLLPARRLIFGIMKSPNSSQYLPPQDPHYTYSGAQVLDAQPVPPVQPARVPYPHDAAFPKLENINEVLQAQQALQANHALNPPLPQQPKTNRLRKACDSCSIRKVKVRRMLSRPVLDPRMPLLTRALCCSAMNQVHPVEPV
jgi:hypothetical protein